MRTAKAYTTKRSKTYSKPNPPVPGNNTNNINSTNNNNVINKNKHNYSTKDTNTPPPEPSAMIKFQEVNLPPNFAKLERWTNM